MMTSPTRIAADTNSGWGLQLSSTGSSLLQQATLATLAFLIGSLRDENKEGEGRSRKTFEAGSP